MQRIASPFDGFRQLKRRRSAPKIITQVSAPTFGPYVPGDTPAGEYVAGTYASTAGTISSAVPSWTINGVSQPGSTVLVEGDVVGLSVLVTDSAANTRTFGYGTSTVPVATIPAAPTSGQWALADAPSPDGNTLSVNVLAAPDDGGSVITSYDFRRNSGSATAMLGGGALGSRQITVLATTAADIQIRAVNAVGPGPWSDTKSATPTVSPAPNLTDLAYDSGTEIASAQVDQDGTVWWFIDNSATPLADGAAVKAVVQAATADLEGSFAVTVGTVDEEIDTSSLAAGTWYLHAAPENGLGVLADEDDVVSFTIAGAGWNLGGASYMSKSFSVSSQDTSPQGIYLSPDGTRLYVIGGANDDLHQYGLSTAWDISTASFVRTRDISANDNQATGVFFKSDGTRCYVVGNANNSIYEYTLSSAWDISTTTLNHTLSIGANQGTPQDVWFSADGLKMYTIGSGTDAIQEYDLGTAWTLSTATYSRQKLVAEDILPHGLHFKDDGSKVYWVGGTAPSKVYQYDLSTAWNITTAAYASISFDLSTQITSGHSIRFGDSGTKFYVVDVSTATIYQYEAT